MSLDHRNLSDLGITTATLYELHAVSSSCFLLYIDEKNLEQRAKPISIFLDRLIVFLFSFLNFFLYLWTVSLPLCYEFNSPQLVNFAI